MTVLCENGVHRCIKFAAEGKRSWFNHFTLTTWPWHLAISGDMGTFVFNRLDDMFQFFRGPEDRKGLYINTGYWHEKCEADDRRTNGVEVYDPDRFKAVIGERFNDHEFESNADKRECWNQIKDEVLRAENEHEAYDFVSRFKFEGECGDTFEFYDFWESNLKSYTYHYVWCCYAIAWGIRQYDNAKLPPTPAPAGVYTDDQGWSPQ
jgi:hypothetical protein